MSHCPQISDVTYSFLIEIVMYLLNVKPQSSLRHESGMNCRISILLREGTSKLAVGEVLWQCGFRSGVTIFRTPVRNILKPCSFGRFMQANIWIWSSEEDLVI
jgi:hypothetical protein